MRIMHISTRLILGGSQENTVLSCEGQADHGHDVALVFGPIFGPEGSMLDRVKRHGGIEAIETPNLVRELSLSRDPKCYRDLCKLIVAWKPDVVHTHSSKAGILGRMAGWAERVPCVVHTVHGPPFHAYEKKWRNGLYIAAERYAAGKCHRIICVAKAMRDQFLAAKVAVPEKYEVVYSGMEVDHYLNPQHTRADVRRELGIDESDFVIGTIARLAEHKGHDDLLDALSSTMRDNQSIRLLWVGDGWWAKRLKQRIDDAGLRQQVTLTGLVSPEEIPRYLQAMDVLAHPSYREGLPRTVVQALLSGIATVAYDVDGTREVCITGETGRLVPPGDQVQLCEALLWMHDHPKQRQAMGQAGRDKCRQQFDAAVMVLELERVYGQVLGTKP